MPSGYNGLARFGKKAALESQKSTKEVECIVSVAEDGYSVNPATGQPSSYYVEAQRLQDGVSEEDALAGLADSSPFITNKKEYYRSLTGEKREKTSHTEQISVYGMEQIRNAAVNGIRRRDGRRKRKADSQLYRQAEHWIRRSGQARVLLCSEGREPDREG